VSFMGMARVPARTWTRTFTGTQQ